MAANDWFDLAADRAIGEAELIAGLAALFDIQAEQITILPEHYTVVPGAPALICHRYKLAGEFVQGLALFGPGMEAPEVTAFAKAFAAHFGCRLLIDDEADANPFAWRLVTPDGDVKRIYLDDRAMGSSPERYVIARLRE